MGQIDAGSWGEIVVGIIAILVAAALSVYFYVKSKKKPDLSYQVEVRQVLQIHGLNTDELEIKFKGKIIKSLCLASLRVRNTGTAPIRPEDWHRNLSFSFPTDVDVFEASIAHLEPDNLNVSVLQSQSNPNAIEVSPLLLNQDDGFIVEVLISEARIPRVDARIVDVKRISDFDEKFRSMSIFNWQFTLAIFLAGLASLGLFIDLFMYDNLLDSTMDFPSWTRSALAWVTNISLALFVVMQYLIARILRNRKAGGRLI